MYSLLASMPGRSHLVNGTVNQDAVAVWSNGATSCLAGSAAAVPTQPDVARALAEAGPPSRTCLALSDGHGSAKYDRSHLGSAYAVAMGLLYSRELEKAILKSPDKGSSWLQNELPRRVVQQWRRLVLSEMGTEDNTIDHISRYGATLLGMTITDLGVGVFQVGDGEALLVKRNGDLIAPTPEKTVLLGSETNSLCEDGADGNFRVSFVEMDPEEMGIALLVSDGISNSFVDRSGFEKFSTDLFHAYQTRPETFGASLQSWIARCSSYSGDDVSIAVAINS